MEQYIQAFVEVCESVFREFCKADIKCERVFFVERDKPQSDWDISGVIGFSGEASGAVVVSMKDVTAFQLTGILTGVGHISFDDDVTDAVGEIINIIAGNVKKSFENTLKVTISLPSIVRGRGHIIVWPSKKARIICVPFSIFSDQEICLYIAMDPVK